MGRGRKPAVSPYERQRWLDELDKGKGITSIASEAKRDIRVVKRQIAVARVEREATILRHDFLLKRLEQHQEDLLNEAKLLHSTVGIFPPVSIDSAGDSQGKIIYTAFREHVKRHSISKMLESHEQLAKEYQDFRNEVIKHLSVKEAALISDLPSDIQIHPWTTQLIRLLEQDGPSARSYAEYEANDGNIFLSWSDLKLNKFGIPEAQVEHVKEAHRKLVNEAECYASKTQEYHWRLIESATFLQRELDIIQIKRVVEGHCQYCPI